jgi:hypothetical protein
VAVTGAELQQAIRSVAEGQEITTQYPSVGCSIKWSCE